MDDQNFVVNHRAHRQVPEHLTEHAAAMEHNKKAAAAAERWSTSEDNKKAKMIGYLDSTHQPIVHSRQGRQARVPKVALIEKNS